MRNHSLERLYQLLPDHIRAIDAAEGRPLQALMQLFTRELEIVEGDIDALYDNWFIETCEDWVVPYIGDLVGARALRPFGGGSLRAYAANTLGYRQAKGTLAAIEQIARDVTGWPCIAVESFRWLIQSQHVNHVRLDNQATMSLRDADLASQVHGPFERAAHTIDVGEIARGKGRYNTPNIDLFVWRLQSYALPFVHDGSAGYLGGVVPKAAAIGPGFRHLDPLGRSIRLFNRPRTEAGLRELGAEPTMPVPLRLRPLAADLDGMRAGMPGAGRYFTTRPVIRVRLDSVAVPLSNLHCCNLEERAGGVWDRPQTAGHVMVDPMLGRISLNVADEAKACEVAYAYGAPHDIGGGTYDRRGSVAAWLGPFTAADAPGALWQIGVTRRAEEAASDPDQGGPVVTTLAEAIDAWNTRAVANARGIIAILDNATYPEDLAIDNLVIAVPGGARLAIVGAGWPGETLGGGARFRRPGVLAPQDRRPHVASNLRVRGTGQASELAGTLILDGLLVEGKIGIEAGDLGRIELRHATVGADAVALGPALEVGAGNTRLNVLIDHSVAGPIATGAAGSVVCICDSIIGEDRVADGDLVAMPVVIDVPSADLVIGRVTVFGRTVDRTLEADDTIFVGVLAIARRQSGCIRFCYVPKPSRTPRRYRCTPDLQIAQAKERLGGAFGAADEQALREHIRPSFVATALGHAAFAQLARWCPAEIAEGGEGGRELGAMNALSNPLRLANLRDALDEYLPFGLTAGVTFVT